MNGHEGADIRLLMPFWFQDALDEDTSGITRGRDRSNRAIHQDHEHPGHQVGVQHFPAFACSSSLGVNPAGRQFGTAQANRALGLHERGCAALGTRATLPIDHASDASPVSPIGSRIQNASPAAALMREPM